MNNKNGFDFVSLSSQIVVFKPCEKKCVGEAERELISQVADMQVPANNMESNGYCRLV